MEKFDVKIFESPITDEAFVKISEELCKNPQFQITDDNIAEFVDCEWILDVLKEHKIKYKIVSKDTWTSTGVRKPRFYSLVCIYISQKDYVSIKHIIEIESETDKEEYDDKEEDKITKNIHLIASIIINLIYFTIGIVFLFYGIQFTNQDTTTEILFITVGGGILIFRVVKIIKLINKKYKKSTISD